MIYMYNAHRTLLANVLMYVCTCTVCHVYCTYSCEMCHFHKCTQSTHVYCLQWYITICCYTLWSYFAWFSENMRKYWKRRQVHKLRNCISKEWNRFSERPPFIEIKQRLSKHYRKLLEKNQNEEMWKMPENQQHVKFVNSTSGNNSVAYNDYYPGGDIYSNERKGWIVERLNFEIHHWQGSTKKVTLKMLFWIMPNTSISFELKKESLKILKDKLLT